MEKIKRTCAKCGKTKDLEDFHKNSHATSGYHFTCKKCRCAYNNSKANEWRKKNPERYNQIQASYREKHREKLREAAREWKQAHKKQKPQTKI